MTTLIKTTTKKVKSTLTKHPALKSTVLALLDEYRKQNANVRAAADLKIKEAQAERDAAILLLAEIDENKKIVDLKKQVADLKKHIQELTAANSDLAVMKTDINLAFNVALKMGNLVRHMTYRQTLSFYSLLVTLLAADVETFDELVLGPSEDFFPSVLNHIMTDLPEDANHLTHMVLETVYAFRDIPDAHLEATINKVRAECHTVESGGNLNNVDLVDVKDGERPKWIPRMRQKDRRNYALQVVEHVSEAINDGIYFQPHE